MSIEALTKVTLYGTTDHQQTILAGLQDLGCIHLLPMNESNQLSDDNNQLNDAIEAVQWLERVSAPRRQFASSSRQNILQAIEDTLNNKRHYRTVSDQRDKLQERIQSVAPWGEFSFPALDDLQGNRLWFYLVPDNSRDEFLQATAASQLCYQIIQQNNIESHIVVIASEEPDQKLPVPRSHMGEVPLSRLKTELESAEQQLDELLAERQSLSRWLSLITQSIARLRDQDSLLKASAGTLAEGSFFVLQGWLPVTQEEAIHSFCKEHQLAALFEQPSQEESPPTLLRKSEGTGGGADALSFFQTPGYRTWDPGNTVFFSFSLFFAMIISDACYSLLIGFILLIIKRRLPATPQNNRLMNLGFTMTASGLLWGVLVGSYFGVAPTSGILADLAVIDLNDYSTMMRLSIVIGVLHLLIANLMSAMSIGGSQALVPLGWAINLIGGLLGWLATVEALPALFYSVVAPLLLTSGSFLVLFFADSRSIHSPKDAALRLLSGFKALYSISSAFGDVLSYMRLFALGLSGASLAMTFNSLAVSALNASPVTGVLFSAIILALGHTLNFALCIMSGIVHGMRLNVIEFVNWGIPEEGYPFQSFCRHEASQWKP